jgi:hypothetical protein
MGLSETMRWRVVGLVNKLPGQCWADLADWAGRWWADEDGTYGGEPYGLPWAPQRASCRGDARRVGSCYCGKLRAEVEPSCGKPVSGPRSSFPCVLDPDHAGDCTHVWSEA